MARRIRRIVLTLAVVLVTGTVALVITVRPGLQDDAHAVDRAWKPLAAPLGERYDALDRVSAALDAAGADDREVTQRLEDVLVNWAVAAQHNDQAEQAATANELERLAARVRVTVNAADKLKADQGLTAAIGAFDATVPPLEAVATYNEAVDVYAHGRDGFWDGLVAALDDYPPRPTLQLSTA